MGPSTRLALLSVSSKVPPALPLGSNGVVHQHQFSVGWGADFYGLSICAYSAGKKAHNDATFYVLVWI